MPKDLPHVSNPHTARRRVELCQCGHRGAAHVAGYGPCTLCPQSTDGRFRCEPGHCDRFTWNPTERRTTTTG